MDSMAVPFVDLRGQYEELRAEVTAAVDRVLRSGQYILGDEVEAFEHEFARYCGAGHCVGVSSGTEALHLALRALQVGPGDEVITAANTFAATAFAISYVGATPVFVDVNPTDFTMDVEALQAAISERTRVIIPVHLYGHPADMDSILRIAHKHGLRVLEDACQAHGAEYRGRRAGSLGDIACFSFYPTKNLGTYGDGGAIVTNDGHLADEVRHLRDYAQAAKNVHTHVGFNSRLDAVHAAILRIKLRRLDEWNGRRREIARAYGELLSTTPLGLPVERPGVRHVYHLYVACHPHRDHLLSFLREHDVFGGIHYPFPVSHQKPYALARTVPEGVPVATRLSQRILSLPMFPELSREQIHRVAKAVMAFDGDSPSAIGDTSTGLALSERKHP
jgi:dTDP-4-amino-4,6-dideoxygalactose transaminase